MAKPEHQARVLNDAEGRKIADKLFDRYVRKERNDFTRHPEFMLALDRLLSSFGGEPADRDDEEDTIDEEADYGDDEDIHDPAAVQRQEQATLRRAMKNILRTK